MPLDVTRLQVGLQPIAQCGVLRLTAGQDSKVHHHLCVLHTCETVKPIVSCYLRGRSRRVGHWPDKACQVNNTTLRLRSRKRTRIRQLLDRKSVV